MARERYIAEVDRPDGMDIEDMEQYIEESVRCMRGSYPPEDPRFHIGREVKATKTHSREGSKRS